MSNRDIDFWKTLANWYTDYERAIVFSHLILSTTANISTSSPFSAWNESKKEEKLRIYHFQRVFSILCGFTIGEYIRNRRLSLAGTELASSDAKVIDVALKYGYESPDSFAKAFQKFHGILPSQARNNGSMLKSYSRLVLKFSLEGGKPMNYRIEKKPEMILTGYKAHFTGVPYGKDRERQEEQLFVTTRRKQWFLRGASRNIDAHCVITNITDEGYDYYYCHLLDGRERDNLYNKDVTGVDFVENLGFGKHCYP